MHATDAAALQEMDDADGTVAPVVLLRDMEPAERLVVLANIEGDISPLLTTELLAKIGADCIADYEQDLTDRESWEETVKEAFKKASQEKLTEKTFPWKGASNVNYPLLTTAALQFAARAYPAIVKGDEAVSCKVVGLDKGRPMLAPDGSQMVVVQGQPVPMQAYAQLAQDLQAQGQEPPPPEPAWIVPPGGKAERANRVREYMNTTIFYRMKGWEEDTDALLHQLPIAGSAFRKVWTVGGQQKSALVPALKLVAPMSAKDCESAPRLTEVREDESYNDILGRQRAGFYRDVVLVEDDVTACARKVLEQHCLIDLDEDDYAEPYIVTLDHASGQVLRIEPNFGPQSVELSDAGEVVDIKRGQFYVKYDFFPSLDGTFYGLGLGQLLEEISGVVNRSINQIIDAGTAQAAGGGFIGSGVNLQGAGKRSGNLRFTPGEYKTVNVSGDQLRNGIYERTFPGPSPITFSVLDLMLGAAKDISSVKDVLTGEASNNGQVGTTLALIEQGLQVFTAIYKRIYRSLKAEFSLLFANLAAYGGEAAAADYQVILDDPEADFAKDFDQRDMDIRPVSDPASVTKMQKMARANFLMQFVSAPGVNPQAIYRRAWEAADVDDIDELLMPPAPPPPPNPKDVAAAQKSEAGAVLDMERAQTEQAKRAQILEDTQGKALENLASAFQTGQALGVGMQ
jgi:chaperonin GroES